MTLSEFIRGVADIQGYSRRSKVLLFAYYLRQYQGKLEFAAKDIRECFQTIALKIPSGLSGILQELARGRNSPLMKATRSRYAIAMPGLNEVEAYLGVRSEPEAEVDSFLKSAVPYLEKIIGKVTDTTQRKFIAESVACLGVDAKRATVVMMWACTVAHLYDFVLAKSPRLSDFNTAIHKRSDKYGKITVAVYDDFSNIPESVFIEICRSAGIISHDVRKILDEKLGIRNTCAHPSGVEVHRTKVVNFIEDLVDNVLIKYPIK